MVPDPVLDCADIAPPHRDGDRQPGSDDDQIGGGGAPQLEPGAGRHKPTGDEPQQDGTGEVR